MRWVLVILLNALLIVPLFGLDLDQFVILACGKDRTFQKIMIEELKLKYRETLKLPPEDLFLSVRGQYDFSFEEQGTGGPRAGISLGKLFPSLGTSLSAEYSISRFQQSQKEFSELTLSVSQPIARNAFGKVNRLLEKIAGLETEVARFQIVEAYEDYLAALIRMYYAWYSSYVDLDMSRTAYKENLKLLDNIRARQDSSIAYQIDVDKIQLQVLDKQANLIRISNTFMQNTKKIGQVIEHKRDGPLLPAEPDFYKKRSIVFLDEYDFFKKTSRTYQTLDLLEEKSRLEKDRYASDLLPSVNLVAGYNLRGSSAGFDNSESRFFTGISAEMPFFGSQEKARSRIAEIGLAEQRLTYTNLHKQLYTDLYNLHSRIVFQKEYIGLLEKKISLSENVLKEEKKNYNFGRVTLNDLLQAQNALEKNRYDRIINQIQLYISMVEWMRITDQLISYREIRQKKK